MLVRQHSESRAATIPLEQIKNVCRVPSTWHRLSSKSSSSSIRLVQSTQPHGASHFILQYSNLQLYLSFEKYACAAVYRHVAADTPTDNTTIEESAFCAMLDNPPGFPLWELSSLIFFAIPMVVMIVLYARMGIQIRFRSKHASVLGEYDIFNHFTICACRFAWIMYGRMEKEIYRYYLTSYVCSLVMHCRRTARTERVKADTVTEGHHSYAG